MQRDLASGVVNHYTSPGEADSEVVDAEVVPEPVTGRDGKTYPAKPKPDVPKPKPSNTFNARFYRALVELQRNALRLQLLTKEQGFAEHINEVCRDHRDGVAWAQEIIAGVLAQMSTDQGELFADTDGAAIG